MCVGLTVAEWHDDPFTATPLVFNAVFQRLPPPAPDLPECPVAAPCKSWFLLEAPSVLNLNQPLEGNSQTINLLTATPLSMLRFLRIESRDSNFNILSNPQGRSDEGILDTSKRARHLQTKIFHAIAQKVVRHWQSKPNGRSLQEALLHNQSVNAKE